jgi:sialate O-acetylesterase
MNSKINFRIFLIIPGLIIYSLITKAEIQLPSIFCNNMVLQQRSDVAIWGKAEPDKEVELVTSWNQQQYTTKSDQAGEWKLDIATPQAGGPYSIIISDGEKLELSNVLIGEVWICSGQSNMEMPMKGFRNQPISGGQEAIVRSENEFIRLFTAKRMGSLTPLNDLEGSWEECVPGHVANFSATAYYFGKLLQETLQVPIGLISTNWGGSIIEAWMSQEDLQEYDFVTIPTGVTEIKNPKRTPVVLYNAMIHPIVGYGIQGVIWYQGEANRDHPKEYEQLFPGLINNWRSLWGAGDFPFYYAQIAPFDYSYSHTKNSAFLREAQLKTSEKLLNTGMACLMDAGEEHCIHPSNKKAAGERLAFQALANTYGTEGIAYSGPTLNEMTIDGNKVTLTFKHAENGLTTFGKELIHFKVAGADKVFYQAKATIERNGTIVLLSDQVKEPVAVRYAFEDFVEGELYNTEGLPASSFRTDDWEE